MKNSRKIDSFLFLIFSFLITIYANSQDVFIKVKNGTIQLNNKSINATSPSIKLTKTDVLELPKGVLVLASIKDKYIEIPADKTYHFADIIALNKKNNTSTNGKTKVGVVNALFIQSVQHTEINAGITTRGGDREPDFYAPLDTVDTLIIISDSIVLEFGNQSSIVMSNFVVKNLDNGKVYYDDKPMNHSISLVNLSEGMYSWKGEIKSTNKKISFSNLFIIKDEAFESDFLRKLEDFKKYLTQETNYSDEMKQILINDFYATHKVYLKE
jgi:hypothetical protein